jgi:hypothetical protein
MKLGFLTHRFNTITRLDEYYYITNKKESEQYEKQGFVPLSDFALEFAKAVGTHKEFQKFIKEIRTAYNIHPHKNKKGKIIRGPYREDPERRYLYNFEIENQKLNINMDIWLIEYDIHNLLLPQMPYIIKQNCLSLEYLRPPIELIPYTVNRNNDTETYAQEYAKVLNIPPDTPKEKRDKLIEDSFDLNPEQSENKYRGLGNFIKHMPIPKTRIGLPEMMLSDALFIKISSSAVKESNIIEFIQNNQFKENWLNILESNNFRISERDYKIYEYRNKGYSYTEISKILDPKEEDPKMTYVTPKVAHKRLKDKLDSLFKKKLSK